MYFEGKANNPVEFLETFKTKCLEAGYESVSDRTFDVSNVMDIYEMGGFSDSGSITFCQSNLNPNHTPNSTKYNRTLTFSKDVSFDSFSIHHIANASASIWGICADNTEHKIMDASVSAYEKKIFSVSVSDKFRKIRFDMSASPKIEIFLKPQSYVHRELVLKKVAGTKELLYIFVLEDAGDKYFLHMSPIKTFVESNLACTQMTKHIGSMPSFVKVVLPIGEFGYSLSIQDRRICGAIDIQSLQMPVSEPFYIGLLRPQGVEVSPDPFLCFGSGVLRTGLEAVSKDGICYPYAKHKNEFLQCISTPNWDTPPTNPLYSDVNEPFATPIFVCYFGRYNNSTDLGSDIKARAKKLYSGTYQNVEAKLLGDIDGIIAIILGEGINIGDTLRLGTQEYKVITAGSNLNQYCYALIKE